MLLLLSAEGESLREVGVSGGREAWEVSVAWEDGHVCGRSVRLRFSEALRQDPARGKHMSIHKREEGAIRSHTCLPRP